MAAPLPEVEQAFLKPVTYHTRRVDIYEADGTTPWLLGAPLTDGSISLDHGRDERRSFELSLDSTDLTYGPTGLWYDKVIKPFRGIQYRRRIEREDGSAYYEDAIWETQLGEFMIDRLQEAHFPRVIRMSGRDYTKKLLTSKFVVATGFNKGASLDATINTIASNAGIHPQKRLIPLTGKVLGKDFIFDRGVSRWEAIRDLADAYGYELFFDAEGNLVMKEFADPVTSPVIYTLRADEHSNLASYEKSVNDQRLYNHIVVTGESSDSETIPVWAEARNDNPSSPTNIDLIGDRLYQYVSSFITTTAQAQNVANNFLAIHSLQEFELSFGSLLLPWLDVGEIVRFMDPRAYEDQPENFLLSSLTIPLGLGAMSGAGKRVTIVG